jgi:toxin ParE1/3/4
VKLVWTRTADETLNLICEYLSQAASPEVARSVEERIVVRAQEILDFPHAGRVVPEVTSQRVREVFLDSYRIIYHIDSVDEPDSIAILGIAHSAQLLENTPAWLLFEDE